MDFMESYRMDKFSYKLEKYYVEWGNGLNKRYFNEIYKACEFANTIKEKNPKIYMIDEIRFEE